MGYGIKVNNAAGAQIVGPDDFLYRILGTVNTGTSNGSVSHSGFAQGTPMFIYKPDVFDPRKVYPDVSVSGTTLSWSFPSASNRVNCLIIYGVK